MAVDITNQTATKNIVLLGNDEVWYGVSTTLTELVAANGDIDTSDQCMIASAFGKVFFANGSNLKVADFINTKIATDDLGTHAPDPGTELTGGDSGAKMIVDYITSTTADAACTIYGKRTTDATFADDETVTGTDDDDNAISFDTNAAETAPKHWYDWTVYGNDTTYGTMPNKAYLVCIYRGRVVLSGNPEYPNQWYMSRAIMPFDYLYGEDDAFSAVAGNNADACQCPDIPKALIPFHDDYLIYGCANSMWVLRGDPVSGGSLDALDNTTGIFGAKSWRFDDIGNLYFWSNSGICKISAEVFTSKVGIENLTASILPDIINDEAADPTTHEITLGYDKKRQGIIVSVVTIADGTNSDYFYSLITKGFYPETYPEECAPYSMIYYAANDPADADLLFGCKDGYIRHFVDSAKSDDIGESNEAINAYFTTVIAPLAEDSDYEGKLSSIVFESAGGAAGGALNDSDGFNYEIHFGDDAETVLEDIMDGAVAKITGTVSGTGRTNKLRKRGRGAYMGVKIYNSTVDETFGINRILYETKHAGRIR